MEKLILVRPEQGGEAFEELCEALTAALASHSDWAYELKIGKNGGCATCTKVSESAKGNVVAFLKDDGVVAIAAKTALLLEENAHRFVIRNFRALTPEYAAPDYAALRMKNVTNQRVTADGTEYAVTKRSDELTLNGFTSLTID